MRVAMRENREMSGQCVEGDVPGLRAGLAMEPVRAVGHEPESVGHRTRLRLLMRQATVP